MKKVCKNINLNNKWFTLIEIIVAITMFMVVMISVMQIFWVSSALTNRVDINRQVQENIKNITESISWDVRNYWVWQSWIEADIYEWNKWNWLKIGDIKYYISNDDQTLNRISDIEQCSTDLSFNCFLVKDDWGKSKLTNSWVAIEKIEYTILWNSNKRIVINLIMRPSSRKWVPINLIKNSKIIFQTTISERFVRTF